MEPIVSGTTVDEVIEYVCQRICLEKNTVNLEEEDNAFTELGEPSWKTF